MSLEVHIGCCGWSFLNEREFPEALDPDRKLTKLQAYAKLFDTVEINSTFYRLPRLSTAEKWRREADEMDTRFEFTVKAFKGITHLHRFQKEESIRSFEIIKDVCSALRTKYVLFQSPASFKPTAANIENMRAFFGRIDRGGLSIVWEPRGSWYDDANVIERVCREFDLVHCVDPFRNDCLTFGKARAAYFRLHGFGKPTMYSYNFSADELTRLHEKVESMTSNVRNAYVFFNNEACYLNGRSFQNMTENF